MQTKSLARFSFPGQFCMLKAPGVFLRRPLSIFSAFGNRLEFLYKVIGKGTKALSELKKGEQIEVLGPLGNSYLLETSKTPLLVAGGTGVASLNFLAQKLKRAGVIFYGAKKKTEFVPLETSAKRGWKVSFSTEDGSRGEKGLVTESFENYLKQNGGRNFIVYACGPNAMLRAVSDICKQYKSEGYVSLEEMMACGVGICQGCPAKSGGTYKMVCKDGPVFNINDVEV